ncbi:FKBP-type peptidyl-prolyl cis-trans isomerase [Nitzschia inconspicua]|uniref:peptidylprolyl isomerase n=1 Tax=Nitzschia inconspicua TaxID=303405 RepID=A0A9K3L0I3_9STRA|nr:FKBP-type peptidyl-prolyl cis-trans isomerase [Nitzschia inconspicua]
MTTKAFTTWFLLVGYYFAASRAFRHGLGSKQHLRPPPFLVQESNRRSFVSSLATTFGAVLVVSPGIANAGIDPALLKNLPVQGDESGSAQRLRQIEAIQKPTSDLVDIPFQELASGVSYREYREGKGEATVQDGSKVAAEMTIRCKSFSTQNEPGGLKYFSTRDDTEFNEIAWTVGSGEILPGLEEAMIGMHRNAVRRIEIPSTQVFAARKANQLPLPTTKDGKRRFDNLFKTDATLLFEVLVTRIK